MGRYLDDIDDSDSDDDSDDTPEFDPIRPAWMVAIATLGAPVAGLVCVVGGLAGGVTWLLWPTHPTTAPIVSTAWEHTTTREHWTLTIQEDWCSDVTERDEVPPVHGAGEHAGVLVTDRSWRTYTYRCGSGKRRTTCTGLARWCTYQTQTWVALEHVTLDGHATDTRWFSFEPMPNDERERQDGRWVLALDLEGRNHVYTHEVPTEAKYLEILHADPNRAIVDLRPGGVVYDVRPHVFEVATAGSGGRR